MYARANAMRPSFRRGTEKRKRPARASSSISSLNSCFIALCAASGDVLRTATIVSSRVSTASVCSGCRKGEAKQPNGFAPATSPVSAWAMKCCDAPQPSASPNECGMNSGTIIASPRRRIRSSPFTVTRSSPETVRKKKLSQIRLSGTSHGRKQFQKVMPSTIGSASRMIRAAVSAVSGSSSPSSFSLRSSPNSFIVSKFERNGWFSAIASCWKIAYN